MPNNLPYPIAILFLGLLLWQFFWKGVGLWKASRNEQRNWFIAFVILFVVNDLGIIELVYLIWFAKKRLTWKEVQSWKQYLEFKKEKSK